MGFLGDKITGGLSGLFDIVKVIPDLIKNILSKLGDVLKSVADGFLSVVNKLGGVCGDILEGIKNVGEFIIGGILEGLEYLFVPSYNPISEIKAKIEERYSFITQMTELAGRLFKDFGSSSSPPSFSITYGGHKMEIVNWKIYQPYRATVHSIIIAVTWVFFVIWVIKFIPKLLKGVD